MKRICSYAMAALLAGMSHCAVSSAQRGQILKSEFTLENSRYVAGFSADGLAEFRERGDSVNLISPRSAAWGTVEVNFRVRREDWNRLETGFTQCLRMADGSVSYIDSLYAMPLWMTRTYTLGEKGVTLEVLIGNCTDHEIEIGDAYLPLRSTSAYDRMDRLDPDPASIFPGQFIPQHSISKHSSFILYSKPSGTRPWYIWATGEDTPLEFFTVDDGYKAYVWSGCTGPRTEGNWRWEHTTRVLGPHESVRLSFSLTSADRYEDIRDRMVDCGLLDIRVAPGYVVPAGQTARLAIRGGCAIDSLAAEYPAGTMVEYAGKGRRGYELFDISFSRLGENMVTVCWGGRETVVEFFVTEPIKVLVEKRSSFLTKHQQHKAPGKWWDGLYGLWDMKYGRLRGPEDSDGFDGWRSYMLACDDPILGKAMYVAAKNEVWPDSAEIASLDYHIDHYVWGGLQDTDGDTLHPYAVWGVPNYYVARRPELLSKVDGWTGDRPKIWRTYDYPHVGRMYWSMYKVARQVPQWAERPADEYLRMAVGTFKAYFTYPKEVDEDAVVYRWGIYDEWVIPDIVAELEERGMCESDAAFLRDEWEKKAKYFIYDDPYPYRSEYSFDRTAFESTYALAKYAVEHPMPSDSAHPHVSVDAAKDFMHRQHYAALAVRGWFEPKYYLNGADVASQDYTHTLTYMAMMGGWSILDYGLFHDTDPGWLELGYNSYMSTWALMNTGTAESGYGHWFPGERNDGAAGMAFVSAKNGMTWIRKREERGVWRYDGEIDLGFGAAFHTARTILVDDDVFGLHVLGGSLTQRDGAVSVYPSDGVLRQFSVVMPSYGLHVSLSRDGLSESQPVVVDEAKGELSMYLTNRSGDSHVTKLLVRASGVKVASVEADGRKLVLSTDSLGCSVLVPMSSSGAHVRIRLR